MSHSSRQLKLKKIIIILLLITNTNSYYYCDDEALVNGVCSPPEAEEHANLHLDLCAVDLLSDGLNDADHDVLQAFSLRVVVKNQAVALLCVGAAEGRRPHPRVDGAQVVVQSIEILKSPIKNPTYLHSTASFISRRPH